MSNGASRLFNVMQKSGTDTVSELVAVKVNSLNPLTFQINEKIIIEEDFYVLNDLIDEEKLSIGDTLTAFSFNNNQLYYIAQGINTINDLHVNSAKELWVNTNITSQFKGQTITLNDSFKNYKYYEILYNLGSGSSNMQSRTLSTGKLPINKFAYMQSFTNYMYWRIVSNISDTSITITDNQYYNGFGVTTSTIDNSRNIPWKILGYKN